MTKKSYIEALQEAIGEIDPTTPYGRGSIDALKMAREMAERLRLGRTPKAKVVSLDKRECALCAYAVGQLESTKETDELKERLEVWKFF